MGSESGNAAALVPPAGTDSSSSVGTGTRRAMIGASPRVNISQDNPIQAKLRESLREISESMHLMGQVPTNPEVTMFEIEVSDMNPFQRQQLGIDQDSTKIWVPHSIQYRPNESFFGPPLTELFGASKVKALLPGSAFGALGAGGENPRWKVGDAVNQASSSSSANPIIRAQLPEDGLTWI